MVCYNPYITGYDFITYIPLTTRFFFIAQLWEWILRFRAHSLHFEPGENIYKFGRMYMETGRISTGLEKETWHTYILALYIDVYIYIYRYSFEIGSYRLHRLYILYIYNNLWTWRLSKNNVNPLHHFQKRSLGLSPNFGALWTLFFGAISHPAHKLMQWKGEVPLTIFKDLCQPKRDIIKRIIQTHHLKTSLKKKYGHLLNKNKKQTNKPTFTLSHTQEKTHKHLPPNHQFLAFPIVSWHLGDVEVHSTHRCAFHVASGWCLWKRLESLGTLVGRLASWRWQGSARGC